MPLDKASLKSTIKAAFLNARNETEDPAAAADALAGSIADAVDAYVKGIGITYTAGLTSPSGAVAGVFNYTIS